MESENILHLVAKSNLPQKIDILFTLICLGYPQQCNDQYGHKFYRYLSEWERKRLLLLYKAYELRKIRINTFQNTFSGYTANGFNKDGVPMIFTVWENDLGVLTLLKIIHGGIDFDHPLFKECDPPIEYKKELALLGCVFKNTNGITSELNSFYPPDIWKGIDLTKSFTTFPIQKCPKLFQPSIVCISDTHGDHRDLTLPFGDILVCAGDLQMPWHKDSDLKDFINWFGEQPHTHKILIAGNHDKLIQRDFHRKYLKMFKKRNIVYLQDSSIEILGLKFWGSPWTPSRPKNNNDAFTTNRIKIMKYWNKIPNDIDVLITHCPPLGIGDLNSEFYKGVPHKGGDYGLKKTINRLLNLKLHIFGHQHYGRGVYKGTNGVYFINCAIPFQKEAYIV
jgi:Icc-related predicted phosphoesterase